MIPTCRCVKTTALGAPPARGCSVDRGTAGDSCGVSAPADAPLFPAHATCNWSSPTRVDASGFSSQDFAVRSDAPLPLVSALFSWREPRDGPSWATTQRSRAFPPEHGDGPCEHLCAWAISHSSRSRGCAGLLPPSGGCTTVRVPLCHPHRRRRLRVDAPTVPNERPSRWGLVPAHGWPPDTRVARPAGRCFRRCGCPSEQGGEGVVSAALPQRWGWSAGAHDHERVAVVPRPARMPSIGGSKCG